MLFLSNCALSPYLRLENQERQNKWQWAVTQYAAIFISMLMKYITFQSKMLSYTDREMSVVVCFFPINKKNKDCVLHFVLTFYMK